MALNPQRSSFDSSLMAPALPAGTWPRLRAWLGARPVADLHDEVLGVEAALPWTVESMSFDDMPRQS